MGASGPRWPDELLLVRHGESAGNVARDVALETGAQTISIAARDCDVPLSPLGEEQSQALGRWFAANATQPAVCLSSPFLRAQQTSEIVLRSAGWHDVPHVLDERLREKELGLLDRLTRSGIEARYPQEVSLRDRLGKFYYRPPRGESWADIVLRLRGAVESIKAEYGGKRVLVVTHQVVVLCLRYVIESLTEGQLLQIDRESDVANCSLTAYGPSIDSAARAMQLRTYNFVAPLQRAGAPITSRSDAAQED